MSGEQPFEERLVLYAEKVIVKKQVVPVEEIRVSKRTIEEMRRISDSVRHEELG